MKRAVFFLAVLVFSAAAFAQPKVAVLDADLQKGIDKSASSAISEKLTERLVLSGRFIVLDRSNVEQVLREREFQLSGLVSDSEISEAGKYLGADFVVAIRVQRVDRTYMVSAKMIAVDTGIIARQASAEGEGRASILLALAEEAGDGLAGIPRKPAASAPRKPAPKSASSARAADTVEVGTRLYAGLGAGGQHLEDSLDSVTYDTVGFDLYGLAGLWKGLCAVGSLSYLDASAQGGGTALSLDAGLGYSRPLGLLLPWVALKAGYVFLDWSPYPTILSDMQYSLDLGADLRLGRLLLGGRLQVSLSAFADSGSYGLRAFQNSFWFMAGWKL